MEGGAAADDEPLDEGEDVDKLLGELGATDDVVTPGFRPPAAAAGGAAAAATAKPAGTFGLEKKVCGLMLCPLIHAWAVV